MAETPRLNGMIRCFEEGKPAFGAFCTPDTAAATAMSDAKYDSIVFEMEHNIWDIRALKDCLQYMLNRRQIAEKGSIAPNVTPLVRVPANGNEKNQWLAKQALDVGAYGVVWPHVDTVDQAYNAVAACRYPRLKTAQRAGRHSRGFAHRRGAILGPDKPRILQEGRCLAARSQR
jgi:4-hydroxy-2-oxoheptanedioate aldolase